METMENICDICGETPVAKIELPYRINNVDSYFANESKQAFLHHIGIKFDLCNECMAKYVVKPVMYIEYKALPNDEKRIEYFQPIVNQIKSIGEDD